MYIWVVMVTYHKDRLSNISQIGYKTYEEAKKFVLNRILDDDLTTKGDYKFIDLENEIEYELKSVLI